MLKEFLAQVVSGQNLGREEAKQAMHIIMSGQASEAQIGAFLTALRIKGETSDEVTGFAETMRNHAIRIQCSSKQVIDTCGTGGDKKGTFNISTTVAFVLAGAGLTVAKHGNRGVSSSCGSADVLTALGINVNLPAQAVVRALDEVKVGFLYAPLFHQAMKYAAKPRQDLGFRTVFNLLGPLTNPANATCQLVGVYERSLTEKVAEALVGLGVQRAMVVHSFDGMDEISTAAPTQIAEVNHGEIRSYVIDPLEYGFTPANSEAYQGGSPEKNAAITLAILQGQRGPKRDIVLLNAAAALMVADMAPNLKDGLAIAAASIDSGAALAKLEELKEFSQREELLLS
ncbi:anthranilate phosphoribosyltransferase [Thermosinus carboxydivorans Nor1]|uniref:Anthranilate phosphoribosyltransferase n=1 Tax=Thermosinus carboxydivorans Nor1 TaxID=401526 RepID=A1HS69_9FIRM|nr:anthranilate phosphoribosyltransferase [Thermosinus carboxydivorans]EAX47134.1 anthranilate phosphoribosyltransferase [Thermosinus carboxydivorans Nor1]